MRRGAGEKPASLRFRLAKNLVVFSWDAMKGPLSTIRNSHPAALTLAGFLCSLALKTTLDPQINCAKRCVLSP